MMRSDLNLRKKSLDFQRRKLVERMPALAAPTTHRSIPAANTNTANFSCPLVYRLFRRLCEKFAYKVKADS
jgi:hypothetical protein